MSPASQLASSLSLRPSHKKQPSVDSQSSTDSTSSHSRSSSDGLWSPPKSRKITPASSVDATSQHGGSKSSSRITSSELASPTSDQSSSQSDDSISYAVAEVDGATFGYLKIPSKSVPIGWSNDPSRLQIVPKEFPADEYTLQGPILAALVSISDHGATRYMISIFSRLYFWTPESAELLYVTELYSLTRILRRMDEDFFGLQTKPLKPLCQHSPPDQPLYHSLWSWEVPEGWSQNICELQYLQEVVSGCYEYGLPLSIPIVVSDGRSGSTEFLLKSGEEYYLYYEISSDLVHIDEPISLHDILCVLRNERYVGLKTTSVNVLPEYGGPNVVADNDVPDGWTNKIDKACCGKVFYEHGIYASNPVLFQDGSLNGTPLYLVEAQRKKYYIWNPAADKISRIEKAEGLQDIVDILKDPSRALSETEV